MVLIVMHHYAVHGGWAFTPDFTLSKYFLQIFSFGGKVGVDIFILITGYFMIHSAFKPEKLVKLVGQIWFYGLIILGFACFKHLDTVNFGNAIQSIIPLGQTSWFAYTYLVMYLFIPVLNPCIKALSKEQLRKVLALSTVLWFVIPTFWNIWPKLPWLDFCFSSLLLFFYLYGLGAYIRLYGESLDSRDSVRLIVAGFAGIFAGYLLIDLVAIHHHSFMGRMFYFSGDNLFTLLMGVGLFLYFRKLDMPYSSVINKIAATTFGIYLIHDSNLLRPYLWHHVFHNAGYLNSAWLPVHAVSTVLIVFIVGAVIDFCRKKFIEKPITRVIKQSHILGKIPHLQ